MNQQLPHTFNEFARGAISAESFEHELLMLCKAIPEQSWEALALLDQHFRRGKIAHDLQQTLRRRIERQALGIERYQPERARRAQMPDPAPAIPVAPDADDDEPTIETIAAEPAPASPPPAIRAAPRAAALRLERAPARALDREPPKPVGAPASKRWRPYFRISPAIALTAVVLAVAASPTLEEGQERRPAVEALDSATAGSGAGQANAEDPANRSDDGPVTLSLSSDRYTVDSDRHVAELSVERSAVASGDTSFLWWTEGSGAKPNEDYIAGKPRRVQMPAGVSSTVLRIPILANPKRRHIEMFYVLIARPEGNAAIGPIHRAAVFLIPQHAR